MHMNFAHFNSLTAIPKWKFKKTSFQLTKLRKHTNSLVSYKLKGIKDKKNIKTIKNRGIIKYNNSLHMSLNSAVSQINMVAHPSSWLCITFIGNNAWVS